MEKINLDWLSWRWFTPERFSTYDWQSEWWLYGIALIPVIALLRWLIIYKFRERLPVALTQKDVKNDPMSILRFIPWVLFACSLALILVALARPQSTNEQVEQWSEGIDIILTLDISESMKIEDFRPNRLEAAKQVARDFVAGRFQDRIGLVVFSGDAYARSPLTTDYELLYTYIDDIDFSLIESRGTAIGSAIAVSTNRLREAVSESKVMILLSDGDNTAGNIDPITAAKLAYAHGIKIYSIAIGKEGKVPMGVDFFGRPNYVENTLDETTLREVAKIGQGNFYRVDNTQALVEVFSEIDKLEKAEVKENRYKETTDYYTIYLSWAVLFLLAWLLTKSTFMANVLVD